MISHRQKELEKFGLKRDNSRWYLLVGVDKWDFRYPMAVSASSPGRAEKFARMHARKRGIQLMKIAFYPAKSTKVMPVIIKGVPQEYTALDEHLFGKLPTTITCIKCKRKPKIENAVAIVVPHCGTEWYCRSCVTDYVKEKESEVENKTKIQ